MSGHVQVFGELVGVRLAARPLHVAIGMFDGVHRGHQAVVEGAVHAAHRAGGLAGVLTFWPHPSRLFRPDHPVRMIFSADERTGMLSRLGIDFVIDQPFTREFASVEAEAFVTHIKSRLPQLVTIYVGENWKFGRGRRGDVSLLVNLARAAGVNVVSVTRLNFNGEPISSTRIRAAIERGDVERAGELLGYPYFASGVVLPGRQLGRTLGFPTLNLAWKPDLRPAFGVYAVRVGADRRDVSRNGVANYGVRPTVDGRGEPLLEVHVLSDCPFSTGDTLHVELLRHVRAERKFASVDELRAQIARDRDEVLAHFASDNANG